MKKIYLKIIIGLVSLVLLLIFSIKVFLEPQIEKKIRSALYENNKDYIVKIDNVDISVFSSSIELETITINSKQKQGDKRYLKGQIASVKIKGIKLLKILFKKDIDIGEVIISNIRIKGKIPFHNKAKPPIISSLNISIDNILIDKTNIAIEDTSTAQTFSVKQGILKVHNLQINKHDTISPALIKQFDFKAKELLSVTPDSNYTFQTGGINYTTTSKKLAVDSFFIRSNYKDYNFTGRYIYSTDCINAKFSNIYVLDFSAVNYFKSGELISSYIEIGKMDLIAFRDNRKKVLHENVPEFQDKIYNFPGYLRIDSIGIINANITYIEHDEEANKPGSIRFNKINANVYNITNDTVYKSKKAYFVLKGKALLMGKGKLTMLLKAELFDRYNTFSLSGTLSGMQVKDLNPMLKNNAYMYATSAKIDGMSFNITANSIKSTGKMILLYHDLDIAIKNKNTDDTTGIKEKVISIIANIKAFNSNPVPGKEARVGIIEYKRDPERFLFNYCFKSILTGVKSSMK